ncbi:MAG: TetR/AcrR family transcriptional regulator [bacterium]|nr:TetR/AcrR family transcriptional regulator [bacterium]
MKVDELGRDTMWRDRAIERSTRTARDRAAKRVQQFLDAARDAIAAKASTEFTVQEVVDQSKQSVRSFYQYFDSKHELLLVLFEEEMGIAVARIRTATAEGGPLDRLEQVVLMVYDLCAPGRVSEQPLFAEFAQRLLVDHPEEVVAAYSPLYEYVAEIVEQVGEAGLLREGRPRRLAAVVLQAATVTAGRSTGVDRPVTGEEVWRFCLHAIVPDHKLS